MVSLARDVECARGRMVLSPLGVGIQVQGPDLKIIDSRQWGTHTQLIIVIHNSGQVI